MYHGACKSCAFPCLIRLTYQAAVWLFENWRVTPRRLTLHRILIAINVFLVILAAYLMVSGVSRPIHLLIINNN